MSPAGNETDAWEELFHSGTPHFVRALTRRAWLHENGHPITPENHHQPLALLGDAWLGAVVTSQLLERFPGASRKQLTAMRSELVDRTALVGIAREHDLHRYIRAGRGERIQGQHVTDVSLAGHVEALIGAAFLEGGLEVVVRLIETLWKERWPTTLAGQRSSNHKGRLKKWVDANYPGHSAAYSAEPVAGHPPHDPRYQCELELPNGLFFIGDMFRNKADAEQDAARAALEVLMPEYEE